MTCHKRDKRIRHETGVTARRSLAVTPFLSLILLFLLWLVKTLLLSIYKADDPSDPNNYRGITICSNLGKLFNSVVNKRLDTFLDKNNIIHPAQIGFTKKGRTTDHVFIVKSLIDKYCNSKDGRLYACFIDFHKAFDSVIHNGMKLKLLQMNVGNKFYDIIENMYNKSTSCVKVDNSVTTSFDVRLGVRQGDNLSPNLFKVFINDLPSYIQSSIDSVKLKTKEIDFLM